MSNIKSYIVDVSSPTCWNEIVLEYKKEILEILTIIKPLFSSYIIPFNIGLSAYKLLGGIVIYEDEIKEIAKILSISFTDCLLFQISYELHSACTSGILKCDNNFVHIRSMDWRLPALKKITIKITVMDKDKYLFDAITWAGLVGIFTGIKKNKFTISLNYKRSENPSIIDNILSIFKGHYPNAFFIRDLLSSEYTNSYNNIHIAKNTGLISPAYFTILYKDCGYTISRQRVWAEYVRPMPYIQTNCKDIGEGDNIMNSYERIEYMNKILHENLTLSEMISYISNQPVKNNDTIYTVIMNLEEFLYINI